MLRQRRQFGEHGRQLAVCVCWLMFVDDVELEDAFADTLVVDVEVDVIL